MQTIILPGFSLKNKDWAHEMKKSLSSTSVIEWDHWTSGNTSFANWEEWLKVETPRALQNITEKQVNIIAKSIGTLVAMNILETAPSTINKLILCGIPLNDLEEEDKLMYTALKNFPEKNFLCIQNENDNHASFADIQNFLQSINPKLKIISKPRDDHDYPYPDELVSFL